MAKVRFFVCKSHPSVVAYIDDPSMPTPTTMGKQHRIGYCAICHSRIRLSHCKEVPAPPVSAEEAEHPQV